MHAYLSRHKVIFSCHDIYTCTHALIFQEIPDGWNFDIDFTIEKDPETMEKGDELALDQSCVVVSEDELRLIPMAWDNSETSKVLTLQHPFFNSFSLYISLYHPFFN